MEMCGIQWVNMPMLEDGWFELDFVLLSTHLHKSPQSILELVNSFFSMTSHHKFTLSKGTLVTLRVVNKSANAITFAKSQYNQLRY